MYQDDHSAVIPELEHELAFVLRWLEANQRRRHYPLDRAHYLVLLLLHEEEPRSSGALANQLGLDASTIARQIGAMQRAGLIEKHTDPDDGRSGLLHLTASGRDMFEEMRRQRQNNTAELFDEWDEASCKKFAELLKQFNHTLRTLNSK